MSRTADSFSYTSAIFIAVRLTITSMTKLLRRDPDPGFYTPVNHFSNTLECIGFRCFYAFRHSFFSYQPGYLVINSVARRAFCLTILFVQTYALYKCIIAKWSVSSRTDTVATFYIIYIFGREANYGFHRLHY